MISRPIGSSRLELAEGDITQQETQAIVNAANTSLLGAVVWMGPSTGLDLERPV